jgi:hypothetical protein
VNSWPVSFLNEKPISEDKRRFQRINEGKGSIKGITKAFMNLVSLRGPTPRNPKSPRDPKHHF